MALWHWHPIFVHFTVGLLFTASVLFIVSNLYSPRLWTVSARTAASWMYWLGIVAALFTAVSGLTAYFTVPNIDEPTRAAINRHFVSALVTATIYLVLAFFLWCRQRQRLQPSSGWTACLVVAIASLLYTGYLGGGLVFVRGVGVDAVVPASPSAS